MDDGSITVFVSIVIPALLLAYWSLAAGSVIATVLLPLPQAFKDAVRLSASRGKTWEQKPVALGPLQNWSVPQSFFLHFYVMGSFLNAAVLLLCCCSRPWHSYKEMTTNQVSTLLCLGMFELHLVRRALETGFMMHYPPTARMHGIAYLFGMSYYIAVPLSLLFLKQPGELYENPVLGVTELPQMLRQAVVNVAHNMKPMHVLGACVFLTGNLLQFDSHRRLAALSATGSDKQQYKIPTGGLFDYVACPHYLAEIVIYTGLAVMGRGQVLTLLMLLWVVVNLALAADDTLKWYRRKFESYPTQRQALIPYLF